MLSVAAALAEVTTVKNAKEKAIFRFNYLSQ